MPVDVRATLGKAVRELEAEKARIDRQLGAIRGLLGSLDSAKGRTVGVARRVRTRRGRRMGAAERRAISQRMKAYWAKRKAVAASSGKAKAASRGK